jgi:hypothetical protein
MTENPWEISVLTRVSRKYLQIRLTDSQAGVKSAIFWPVCAWKIRRLQSGDHRAGATGDPSPNCGVSRAAKSAARNAP